MKKLIAAILLCLVLPVFAQEIEDPEAGEILYQPDQSKPCMDTAGKPKLCPPPVNAPWDNPIGLAML